jgi:YVTN family beta-propeller protein
MGVVLVVAGSLMVLGLDPALAAADPIAYVPNQFSSAVTPIDLATNNAGTAINVGTGPTAVAITPDGKTAYVTNGGSSNVTPINLATNTAGGAINVGSGPSAVAITPDGKTAYVTNGGSSNVTPINLATNTAGTSISVGNDPDGIAITPDGKTAYVTNGALSSNSVTPIDLATNAAGTAINVGAHPDGIAITPDGKTAYVANGSSNSVTPINLATNTVGTAITVGIGTHPLGIAITPDGKTAYVTILGPGTVTPIATATNTAGTPITVGSSPQGIAITPDGTTAYVATLASGTVTPIDVATNTAGTPIAVGGFPVAVAITPDQAPTAAFTAGSATAGQPTSFDASASSSVLGTITIYAWDFGDGQTATTTTPQTTHTYSTAGDYTARLTVTDSAGTSVQQVFTGQTVSLQGGPQATITHTLTIPAGAPTPPVSTAVSPPVSTAVSPPVSTAPPLISGTPSVGQTLAVSDGVWSGPTSGFTYQWKRDGVPIAGAVGQTYVVQAADMGHAITCTVTAADGSSSSSATSAGVSVPVVNVNACPKPSGRLAGTTLGPISLGLTRAKARRMLPRFDVRSYHTDNFCLSGGQGIRVGYASTRLLGKPSPAMLSKVNGRVVLELTANPFYTLRGVREGMRLTVAARRLKLGNAIHWGPNDWYVIQGRSSNGVLKVRHGIVSEVGVANRQLTNNHATQLRLLRNF